LVHHDLRGRRERFAEEEEGPLLFFCDFFFLTHPLTLLTVIIAHARAPCQSEGRVCVCFAPAAAVVMVRPSFVLQQEKEKEIYPYHPRSSCPLLLLLYCITFLSLLFLAAKKKSA
jgi:hypothetical protein